MPRGYLQATVLVLAFAAPGCAPPEVALMHMMPGAMPLPTTVRDVQVEAITVYPSAGTDPAIAQDAANQLERLTAEATRSLNLPPTQPTSAARRVVVDAEAWLTLTDHRGRRVVRVYNKRENKLQDVTLPSLVREASLLCSERLAELSLWDFSRISSDARLVFSSYLTICSPLAG